MWGSVYISTDWAPRGCVLLSLTPKSLQYFDDETGTTNVHSFVLLMKVGAGLGDVPQPLFPLPLLPRSWLVSAAAACLHAYLSAGAEGMSDENDGTCDVEMMRMMIVVVVVMTATAMMTMMVVVVTGVVVVVMITMMMVMVMVVMMVVVVMMMMLMLVMVMVMMVVVVVVVALMLVITTAVAMMCAVPLGSR